MSQPRTEIVTKYAGWTALSALRSGCPVKSRQDIYGLLTRVPFERLLDPSEIPVQVSEFASWHREAVLRLGEGEPRLAVGWASKLVNVYLKTAVYVGGLGRPSLVAAIHPPIDHGLWAGLQRRFRGRDEILSKTHVVSRIRDIIDYPTYATIIAGCRIAAEELGCILIEVEQLWEGADHRSA